MIDENKLEHSFQVVKEIAANKPLIIPIVCAEQSRLSSVDNSKQLALLTNLLEIKVSRLSTFSESVWDYNEDYLNPPKSVKGAKLRIDFSKYTHIPPYVLTELKCLLHLCILLPMAFRKKKDKKKSQRSANKQNTIICHFEAGFRFIDAVFKDLNELGVDFVKARFQSLTDILDSDYRKTARNFEFSVGSELRQFLQYLNHPYAINVLATDIKVDFTSLEWPEQEIKRRKQRLVFENDDFEKLLNHATFTVVDFLLRISEEVYDKNALKHYEVLNQKRNLSFGFDKSVLNDYTLIRLWTKGYSQDFISSKCDISHDYCDENGDLIKSDSIRRIMKQKHNIAHFDEVRLYINEVYYSAAYIVGQLTGMRPEEMSETMISNCLTNHQGFRVLVSNVKKNSLENLKLFDDKWVAIPIMEDALTAAHKISILKNNDYLFSNVDTVDPNNLPSNMNPGGIAHFINNFLVLVLGSDKAEEIKFTAYMIRHTLAYQLHRIELGLPFISFQLKHVVDKVGKYTSFGASSNTTLGYGEIAENITADKARNKQILRYAEVEKIKTVMDPDGVYAGPKAAEHKVRIQKVFQGYMEAGYSKEEVFDAMAEQGMAVINVGTGFCFGGTEDYDESLPCIGTLRCNPNRCNNAIVGKANAPKWREIYVSNKALLGKEGYEDRESQLIEAIEEARGVLIYLGEDVD